MRTTLEILYTSLILGFFGIVLVALSSLDDKKPTPDYREEVRILHEQNQLLKAENNHLDSVIVQLQKRKK
jgi:hypothetical protein